GRSRGQTPDPADLTQAVHSGSEPIVRLLLEAGAGLGGRDNLGNSALAVAARQQPGLVPLLLDAALGADAPEADLGPALSAAVIAGHPDVIGTLLGRGAGPGVKYEGAVDGETPLIRAAGIGTAGPVGRETEGRDEAVARLLLAHGADIEARDDAEG